MKPVAFLRSTWGKRKERKTSQSNELDNSSHGRLSLVPAHHGAEDISYGTPKLPIQSPSQFDVSPKQYAGSFCSGEIPPLDAPPYTSRRPSTEPAMRRRLHSASSNHSSLPADESGAERNGDKAALSPAVRMKRLPALPDTSRSIPTPRRPPRPPSLKLSSTELTSHASPLDHSPLAVEDHTSLNLQRQGSLHSLHLAARRMPELDGVWKGFLDDAHEILRKPISPGSPADSHIFSSRRQAGTSDNRFMASCPSDRRTQSPSKSHSYSHATGSTSYLPYLKNGVSLVHSEEEESDSQTEDRTEATDIPQFSLSLFPAPPPLVIRKRPKPLILRATPTIAPLPPSPCLSSFGSPDSTPLATPTTPKASQTLSTQTPPRKTPVSILKAPASRISHDNPPPTYSPPATPLLTPPTFKTSPQNTSYATNGTRPLRFAHSVANLRVEVSRPSVTHKSTSSDSASESRSSSDKVRRGVFSRPEFVSAQNTPHSLTAPPINWGYAV